MTVKQSGLDAAPQAAWQTKGTSLGVALVARTDSRTTGLARYVYSLYETFQASGYRAQLAAPIAPPLPDMLYTFLAKRGLDGRTFFSNYPLRVEIDGADVCHLTSQNLATLIPLGRMPPTVVTVHDLHLLIERMRRKKAGGVAQWADRLAVAGIRRAHAIIAISEYTRRTIVELLHYPAERISVIYRAVDTSVFKPLTVRGDFRARYNLPPEAPIVLYVGSEDPRKNLITLVDAFRHVCARIPSAVLVKAGAVHFREEAERIRQKVQEYGIASNVAFIEDIPDEHLPLLYNTADVFVIPSRFEGFGLPALEAMACGRPVVAANATSLPEVVGEAGILFHPERADELTSVLITLLEDADQRREFGEMAIAHARTFSLARQAEQTWQVYCQVVEPSRD
jgi:glycosyltransferase involved in cell wall biosynthesis